MATHWAASTHQDEKKNPAGSSVCEAKQKDGCERSEASALSPAAEEEPFSWPGPKTLQLRRTSHGFGFTLRHFIVYPPESAVQSSLKDEDNSSRGKTRNRLEPMDTIFVKQVKEGGPAHGTGLCTGDRIVKVNGESIIGKTYSQVIALIQNSDTSLELCVMPKDEDILQLAYSQDAYLKGNEAYSGNAQNIPEPPPICYPWIEPNALAMAQVLEPSRSAEPSCGIRQGVNRCYKPDIGCCIDIPVSPPTASQTLLVPNTQTIVRVFNENVRSMVASPESIDRVTHVAWAGPSHRKENQYVDLTDPSFTRSRDHATSSPTGAAQSQNKPNRTAESTGFSNLTPRTAQTCVDTKPLSSHRHTLTTTAETFPSATSPTPYTPSPPPATPSPCSPHQNIDWRNYTTYKEYIDNKRLYMYGSRTIQERLDSLRATSPSSTGEYSKQKSTSTTAMPSRGFSGSQLRRRSASHDRSYQVSSVLPLRSASQERLGGADRASLAQNWPRSASQDALPSAPIGIPKPRAYSCSYLSRQNENATSILDRQACCRTETDEWLLVHRGDEARASRHASSLRMAPHRTQVVFNADRRGSSYPGLPITPLFSRGTDYLLTSRAESLGNTSAPSIIRPSLLPAKNYVSDPSTAAASYIASALASIQGHIIGSSSTGPIKDQRTPLTANHMPHNAKQLQPRGRADSLQEPIREVAHGGRSSSCSAASKPHTTKQGGSKPILTSNGTVPQQPRYTEPQTHANEKTVEGIEGQDATVVVVRREKKSGSQPIRHPSYIMAVNEMERGAEPPADSNTCWLPNKTQREMHMRKQGDQCKTSFSSNLDDSLDSIPFIDEPSSSSNNHDTTPIPASAVISSTPVITTIPPSPTFPSPVISRQLSHDQDSLRLTIMESDSGAKTERSRSFDEGLDNYREEERGRSIKHTHGFKGLRKAVDRSSEDSTSDVFTDATKEGPLHFRQLNSDKGKRVGSGMRSWKQIYAVLRGHCLYVYKDKRDGQTNANSQIEEEPLPISIKACLIDISYSETKRKNVLRLTTSDCEYLFQAEDHEEMLSWIRVIQESSNLDDENATVTSTDLINRKIKEYNTLMSPPSSKTEPSPRASRQSLSIRQTLLGGKGENKTTSPHSPNKDQDRKAMHKDETSPPKDKGTWRKGIPGLMRKPFEKKSSHAITFGVRLDDCPPAQTNRFVPLIVEVCCKLVEERGLEYTGIYRVPGNNATISIMQEELNNKGMGDINIQDDKWKDLNVISSLLKSFFRKLPEPLFTNEKYADFIDANRIEDPVERLKGFKRLLHELPDHHYETLKFLSAHLKTVAENSEKNKMEPRNLAIVFGPTLVRTSEDNMTHMVTHMPDQYKIVETLIQHYDWFFTEEGDKEPTEESAVESQPVPNIDHLLTNIGRTGTSPGEVSDSPTSDSAKSKGSWGSGKDHCSRKFLQPRVSSIFAAANRKRKKHKEKLQTSSSDDDLDIMFTMKDNPTQKQNRQSQEEVAGRSSPCGKSLVGEKKNSISAESAPKNKKEHRNSFFMKDKPSSALSPSPKLSCSPGYNRHTSGPPRSTQSDPSSQLDETTSDLGTMSSGTSVPRTRPRKWCTTSPAPEQLPAHGGASLTAEVSSITSDYSTTSSTTFLTGVESITLSPEVQSVAESRGGDEADDERSELISEGRPMETDSESDFPMFSPGIAGLDIPTTEDGSNSTPKLACRLLPSHKLIECNSLPRRRSPRQKTDSDSSVEAGAGGGNQGVSKNESNRLSRVLEVMKRGRSTSNLSASLRTESDRVEPAWHLKITERLKFRLRASADDMFGVGTQKTRSTEMRGKKKGIRRRHTMGGQQDFAELDVIHDWREQGGVDQGAELSAVECLKPKCVSQDMSVRDWIAREHRQTEGSQASLELKGQDGLETEKMEETHAESAERLSPSASPCPQFSSEQVNGGASKGKSRNSLNSGADAHPQKLSGAQVVRSRFYQYL
ncbi:rho GTPase-activating protein 21-like isoform X2 [Sinocyclocheilus anshuiensis]|uniref:rho GTPase-activating protein 21-like isoform X2 n=1 Tax=Sinocyclocheilus anshuiensis TaxID=1608454 RepID=UPI0007B7E3AC|nr:PREDICTED: rho GTPase-activating protein 21-like isoform X2 [Sinocyclocheilus anshuiensis]